MPEKEMIQRNIEEFSRLQDYMIDSDKGSKAYEKAIYRAESHFDCIWYQSDRTRLHQRINTIAEATE